MPTGKSRAKTDEVSKYIFTASKPALLDFISAIFHIPLNKDEVEISLMSSEYITEGPSFSKVQPDIVLEIRGKTEDNLWIHIEVQTKHNSTMDLRMVKYGYIIGTNKSEINEDFIRVITIPHKVVIYLEDNKKIRDELVVRVILPDKNEIEYKVPVFRLYQYTARELKDMDLYLLLPLILEKYRKRLKSIARTKNYDTDVFDILIQEILKEVACITKVSDRYAEDGKIDDKTKDIILSATMEIYSEFHDKYIKDTDVKEKVDYMIESVMQKRYIVGKEEGRIEGKLEGKIEGQLEAAESIAKNLILIGMDDNFIIKATGLSPDKITQLRSQL